jgi:hypothetical protein
VVVRLSARAQRILGEPSPPPSAEVPKGETSEGGAPEGAAAAAGQGPNQLSPEEKDQVRKLQQRDAEVRAHEAAHAGAAGGLAGGASYSYQTGPDGRSYAVGGEVSIDVSAGSTPEETISKAQTVRAAAMAPADPSGQDMAVAAQASRMEAQARREISQRTVETGAEGEGEDPFLMSARLSAERQAMQGGGIGHLHMDTSCGFCRKAVGTYG